MPACLSMTFFRSSPACLSTPTLTPPHTCTAARALTVTLTLVLTLVFTLTLVCSLDMTDPCFFSHSPTLTLDIFLSFVLALTIFVFGLADALIKRSTVAANPSCAANCNAAHPSW